MPALKVFGAADEGRGPGEGLLFDRLPKRARQDERLRDAAKILLAALIPSTRAWPAWIELEDEQLSRETGHSRSKLHRNFQRLEETGWIRRVRGRG